MENDCNGHHDWMSLRYSEEGGSEYAMIPFCCIECELYCEEMVSKN